MKKNNKSTTHQALGTHNRRKMLIMMMKVRLMTVGNLVLNPKGVQRRAVAAWMAQGWVALVLHAHHNSRLATHVMPIQFLRQCSTSTQP